MNENKRYTKLISTLASTTLLFLTALSTQAFIRQPSSRPPPASRSFVTEEEVTRTFAACKFLTKEDLQVSMDIAIRRFFPMQLRLKNAGGELAYSNPRSIVAVCLNGEVAFKAEGTFIKAGQTPYKKTIGFSVSTRTTATYLPRSAPHLSVVKSATVCPAGIRVHDDSDVNQGMRDKAQMMFDYHVRKQASCVSIERQVIAYVRKGGRLF